MQITFDTTTITDDEVRGIFALLDTVRPKTLAVGEQSPVDVEKFTETLKAGLTEAAGAAIANRAIPIPAEAEDDPTPPDTDANGLPWDERIHSSTKALNADGTWRTKRGVDKALVAEVETELRAEAAGYERIEGPAMEIIVPATDAPAPSTPPAPPAPPAPTPEPAAPTPATSPFAALMKRVTTAQGSGKLTAQRVKELLESLDKKSIMDLRTDTDALDAFAVLLDGEGV